MQNGHVESLDGRLRDEGLNANWFRTPNDVPRTAEAWRQEYNWDRPHGSLAYRTPAEFGKIAGYANVESKQQDSPKINTSAPKSDPSSFAN